MEQQLSDDVGASDMRAVLVDSSSEEKSFRERLSTGHVVGLAMADVSPTMAVFLLSGAVFVSGGTLAAGVNILMMGVVTLTSSVSLSI